MTSIPPRRPNAYTGSPIDRAAERRDQAAWIAAALSASDSLFLPLWRSQSLMRDVAAGTPAAVYVPAGALAGADFTEASAAAWAFLGLLDGRAVFTLDISHLDEPHTLLPESLGAFTDLRAVAGTLPATDAAALAHARGLMHWRSRHRFCGVCGSPCTPRSAGNVLACSGCGTQHFPRTDPAVIMLVTRAERALLGHSQRFPLVNMYSTLAGFVEPGESLEEAVAREVREEAGVLIGPAHYHSSQPWPFPASIMLGFHAEALTEDIIIDPTELRDARWFSRTEIRYPEEHGFALPRSDSIARRLIEDWVAAE